MDTYAELKIDQSDQTEAMVGFKTRFVGGEVRGSINSAGKMQSIYRKFINIFELELQTTMDMNKKDAPIDFGVALSLRQM